jgi:protein-S-isoprenylcysteine O-methyltransferase Ste14
VDIDKDSAKVTFPPPLVYIGVLLLGLVLDRFLPWSLGGGNGFSYFGAGLLLLSGVTCLLLASGKFRRLGTDLKPWKPTSAIADDGIYAVTRNPMYLGMAFVYLALISHFNHHHSDTGYRPRRDLSGRKIWQRISGLQSQNSPLALNKSSYCGDMHRLLFGSHLKLTNE